MKRLLALPLFAALAGCGVIPLPPQALPDLEFTTPVPLNAALVSSVRVFSPDPLFDAPVPRTVRNVTVTGTAALAAPVTQEVRLTVLIARTLPDCEAVNGYRICTSGGEPLGTITFAPGTREAQFTLRSRVLDELAYSGQGYVGLQLTAGSVPAGTTLRLNNLRAGAFL